MWMSNWSSSGSPYCHLVRAFLELVLRAPYLGNRCSEYHNLVQLTDALHELIYPWPLDYIDVVVVALNFNGYCEVSLMKDLCISVSFSFPSKSEAGH